MGKPMVFGAKEIEVEQLDEFVQKYCEPTLRKRGFRLTEKLDRLSFNNAVIRYENDFVILEFFSDRERMSLEAISRLSKDKKHRYSIELLRQVITQEPGYFPMLDPENGLFLAANLSAIVDLFNAGNLEQTLETLKKLERKRSKVLFG